MIIRISRVSHLRDLLINVEKELPLSESARKVMKTFFIQVIYGDAKGEIPRKAKSVKLKSMKRKSII